MRNPRPVVAPLPPLLVMAVVLVLAALIPRAAAAAPAAEVELANKYAPVVMAPPPPDEEDNCADTAYLPVDVALLFNNPEVALRGPWAGSVVKVAPSEEQVAEGLPGYSLDFPGDPLAPQCTYIDFQKRLLKGDQPTIYARTVVADGEVTVQYWFFYVFNDWQNRHEGDWEMMQVNFPAATVEEALRVTPTGATYSQHAGNETVEWNEDGPLEIQNGTHPVVYPSFGSHANYYSAGVFVGRGGREGLGCDDTQRSTEPLDARILVIPSNRDEAVKEFPWVEFRGRWGERLPDPFNGAGAPITKMQWTKPVEWAQKRSHSSSQIPSGGGSTTLATDVFCRAVGVGATITNQTLRSPQLGALFALALLAGVIGAAAATDWTPSNPLRLMRRRRVGQIFSSALRMYARAPLTFVGIGATALVASIASAALLWSGQFISEQSFGAAATLAGVVYWIGTALPFVGFGVVIAAAARACADLDAGKNTGPVKALRSVVRHLPALAVVTLAVVVAELLLSASTPLTLIGVVVALLCILAPVVVALEGRGARASLARSARLAMVSPWNTTVVVLLAVGMGLLSGPLVGVATIVATGWPFWLLNLLAGVIYVGALSLAGVTLTYLYADLHTRRDGAADLLSDAVLDAQSDIPHASKA